MKKLLLLLIIIALTSINIFGQEIPKQIDYQGVLKTSAGVIVPDGNYPLTFKIYNDPTGGTALWSEAQTVAVANGIFSAHLGSTTPITTVPFNRIHFLGITLGTEPELSPRTMLTPSPYSFMTLSVMDNIVTTEKIVDGTITGTDIANNTIGPEKLNFTPGSGTIGGSGTTNYLPLFTASTTLGNSILYETGNTIGINTTAPNYTLGVNCDNTAGLGLKLFRNGGVRFLMSHSLTTEEGWALDELGTYFQLQKMNTAGAIERTLFTALDNGYIGIGTTSPITNLQLVHDQYLPWGGLTLQQIFTSNRWQFYVSQSSNYLRLLYNDASMGAFDNTNGNYVPVSDMRLKKNIQPMNNMLDIVMELQPKTYQMKNENNPNNISYGLIAQDVENVLPEIVTIFNGDDGDGIKDLRMLSYTELIPILIKAMQEQQNIIEDLTRRVENLEKK